MNKEYNSGFNPKAPPIPGDLWLIVFFGKDSKDSESVLKYGTNKINTILERVRSNEAFNKDYSIIIPEYCAIPTLDPRPETIIKKTNKQIVAESNKLKEKMHDPVFRRRSSIMTSEINVSLVVKSAMISDDGIDYSNNIKNNKNIWISLEGCECCQYDACVDSCEENGCRRCKMDEHCRHGCIYLLICKIIYGFKAKIRKLPGGVVC